MGLGSTERVHIRTPTEVFRTIKFFIKGIILTNLFHMNHAMNYETEFTYLFKAVAQNGWLWEDRVRKYVLKKYF